MQCKWRRKLDIDLILYDDKIVVNQLRLFLNLFFYSFNDVMIAAVCSKSERFNESIAKWLHDSGSSMHMFLGYLSSQTEVCLNNGRRWKTAQERVSLLVLQRKGISLPLKDRNHREALIAAAASMSQWPLSIRDFRVPLQFVYVD